MPWASHPLDASWKARRKQLPAHALRYVLRYDDPPNPDPTRDAIACLMEGRATLETEPRIQRADWRGVLCLFPRGCRRHWRLAGRERLVVLGIRLHRRVREFDELLEHPARPRIIEPDPALRLRFDAVHSEVVRLQQQLTRHPVRDRLILSHLRTFLLELRFREEIAGGHDEAITRALSFIHRRPYNHFTVEGLAHHVGLGRSVFAERFAHQVGMPPVAYAEAERMRIARDELRGGQRLIGEIAQRLGYPDPRYFARRFRAVVGCAPSEYRRRLASADATKPAR